MKISRLQATADTASELVKALANKNRLAILCQLIERERSVGELAEALDLRDSGVSQHLALLRRDGMVAARREGQTVWYSISSAPARALVELLYRLYCGPQPAGRSASRRKAAASRRRRTA